MFALPGILLLLVLIYIRPQEFLPALRGVPAIHVAALLALGGFVVDVRLWRSRWVAAPQLGWALLLCALSVASIAVRAPGDAPRVLLPIAVAVGLFAIIAHGVQTFRALRVVVATLLALTLALSVVGVHQRFAPLGCLALDGSDRERGADQAGIADGRPCASRLDCELGDSDPGADYLCEHVGLLGTSSIGGGRVRYRGHLNDPNELALTICIGLPFAFFAVERKRSVPRIALWLASMTLVAACTVFTESRGGQAVFLTVIGVYFVRRYGRAGLLAGALLAVPILLLGGRAGEEATSSSGTRLDAWYEGLRMLASYPLLGVGPGQYADHHIQTAHNAYLLAASEIGLPGLLAWSAIIYLSLKVPVQALRELEPAQALARSWAMALLASLAGLAVGVIFLSFTFHPVLWIYVGLTGAFAAAVRAHRPDFRVGFGWSDLGLLAAGDAALLLLVFAWTRTQT